MKNIYGYTLKMLEDYFVSNGENPAKAKIVFKALYQDKITDFSEIKTLGDVVKNNLKENFEISHLKLLEQSNGVDTCKYLFELSDGNTIETVLMKHDYGNGVCVSTQVGCNMDCAFCESGKLKKIRNLTAQEMVQQVLYIIDVLKVPVSRVVLMGIGEPFDNYDNIVDFIDIITEQHGIVIASRHITVSTSGIAPKIIEFSKRDNVTPITVSLHAPNNELRSKFMPINKKYPIEDVISAVKEYVKNCNKKVTFAYIMIKGLNDTEECAMELVKLVSGLKCYINLIPYNKTSSSDFEQSDPETVSKFFDILKKHDTNVTVRREFGGNLNAACGQLKANYNQKNGTV